MIDPRHQKPTYEQLRAQVERLENELGTTELAEVLAECLVTDSLELYDRARRLLDDSGWTG